MDAGDDGHELESETAVAAAKRWYDEKGPFTGRFVLALPVLGAFRNSPTEYSLRYKVHPDTGDVVRAIASILLDRAACVGGRRQLELGQLD